MKPHSKSRRITQSDIAQRANVSISTVSRVLNNHPHVDDQTRLLIQQAAAELAYPTQHLRGVGSPDDMSPEQDHSILLICHDSQPQPTLKPFRGTDYEILMGINAALDNYSMNSYIFNTSRLNANLRQLYSAARLHTGFILIGGILSPEFVQSLKAIEKPFVLAGAHALPVETNCVLPDVHHGMEQLISYLVSTGRRKIGMVKGPPTTTSSQEKYRAYRMTLALHDLEYKPDQSTFAEFTLDHSYEATFTLLERRPNLDAIVYATDDMAIGGLRAIHEMGRRVPDDIAVTGFNNYADARFTKPTLTTVETKMRTVGQIATERLHALIDHHDDHQNLMVIVPTQLVIRESA